MAAPLQAAQRGASLNSIHPPPEKKKGRRESPLSDCRPARAATRLKTSKNGSPRRRMQTGTLWRKQGPAAPAAQRKADWTGKVCGACFTSWLSSLTPPISRSYARLCPPREGKPHPTPFRLQIHLEACGQFTNSKYLLPGLRRSDVLNPCFSTLN